MASEDQSANTNHLLEQAQAGDQRALEALFADHRKYLRRVVELRMSDTLKGRVDPSDVVQETHLAATRRLSHFLSDRRVSFRIWLRQTAIQQLVNLERHHVQAQKRTVRLETRLPERSSMMLAKSLLEARPSRIARQRELTQQVRDVVESMSEKDREILLLRHFEELTNTEISEVLGIEADAVSKRYGRAILRLREKLVQAGISELG